MLNHYWNAGYTFAVTLLALILSGLAAAAGTMLLFTHKQVPELGLPLPAGSEFFNRLGLSGVLGVWAAFMVLAGALYFVERQRTALTILLGAFLAAGTYLLLAFMASTSIWFRITWSVSSGG